MKTAKAIILAVTAIALAMPVVAQPSRSGGGGGGSRSHSSAPSRSSSSYSSSSRSSAPSRSYSAPSSSSRSSYNTPSRSNSSTPSRSYNAPSRSNSTSPASSRSMGQSAPSRSMGQSAPSRSMGSAARTSSMAPTRSDMGRQAPAVSGAKPAGTTPTRSEANPVRVPSTGEGHHVDYARPGHPGGHLPPSARPIHPAPYFHHPWHHHYVHCHPIYWDPLPPRHWYWPGFWMYCNSYWYDYHVTDVVVVREYVKDTYKVDIVTYGISGDIMYAIVKDGGDTYLQVYDKDDHLLAEQKIHRKYCNMVIDADNGGCWISKKGDKDPLLFIWADGKLLIYEED